MEGSDAPDHLHVTSQGTTQIRVRHTVEGQAYEHFFDRAMVDEIWLKAGAGDDVFVNDTNIPSRAYGGSGADKLIGGSSDDRLYGGENDESYDLIFGRGGNDWLEGEGGNDHLVGGSGEDRLYGGRGSDVLRGGSGADHLYGGNHTDFLFGGSDDDWLYGESGKDVLEGGVGKDHVNGGADEDRALLGPLDVVYYESSGNANASDVVSGLWLTSDDASGAGNCGCPNEKQDPGEDSEVELEPGAIVANDITGSYLTTHLQLRGDDGGSNHDGDEDPLRY